jgi:uncharacterized protein (TIGR02145 family)
MKHSLAFIVMVVLLAWLSQSSCGSSKTGVPPDSGARADVAAPNVADAASAAPYTKADNGIPWTRSIGTYGTLTDQRDRQVYRTVTIGTQTWMAENLSYAPPGSESGWCYQDAVDNCPKLGRLYTWPQAMAGASSGTAAAGTVRGICPAGWHVSTVGEWSTLLSFVQADARVGAENGGRALRSTSGWNEYDPDCSGWDFFGFRALAAGCRYFDGYFMNAGNLGYWWTATETDSALAQCCDMNYGLATASCHEYDKTVAFSVRCLQD